MSIDAVQQEIATWDDAQLRRLIDEPHPIGRSLHVHRGFAIYNWEDFADRYVKVFSLRRAIDEEISAGFAS